MPATQPAVEKHVKMEELLERRAQLWHKKRALDLERKQLEAAMFDITHQYNRIRNTKGGVSEKREFIKPCPAEGCRGFLSTQWKCGICQVHVCNKCQEIKQEDIAHQCDPEILKNIEAIKSDSKPCPKCGITIHKINGCFAKDVPLRMWDGATKMSQDICIGDEMIGDDGNKRVVLDTFSGEDDLYEVHQNDGMTYTVNSKHTLVLKFSGDRAIHWSETRQSWKIRWFDSNEFRMRSKSFPVTTETTKDGARSQIEAFAKTLTDVEEIEMTVDQYMKLLPSTKRALLGFKCDGVNWPKKDVPLDPYLLGVWIGDGISNGQCFTGQDTEVLEYIWNWCAENGMEMVHDGPYKYRIRRREMSNGRHAIGRGASCNTCVGCVTKRHTFCDKPAIQYQPDDPKAQVHILRNELSKLGLIGNKHIPLEYITNDRKTRLEMLAGLTDTDGCLSSNDGKRIQIVQSKKQIVDQIEFLAKSLGFTVHINVDKKKNIMFDGVRKDYGDCYKVNISGARLSDVPTRIQRKQCFDAKPNKDWMRTSIDVKPMGRGTYYGFVVDGNHRICLADMTVTRNCDQMYCTQCHTAFSWRTGRIETGPVHNPHFYEWQRQQNGGVAPRVPGDIPCGGMPTMGMFNRYMNKFKTLAEYPELYNTLYGLHRLSTHIEHITIPQYRYTPPQDPMESNEDLRVSYLRKQIDEDQLKVTLQKREKKRNKDRAIYQVLEVYIVTARETFQDILRQDTLAEIVPKRDVLMSIIEYCNEQMSAISKRYHCTVPIIDTDMNTTVSLHP